MNISIQDFSIDLVEKETNYFLAKTHREISYAEDDSDLCFALENQSFWFSHRRNCILEVIKSFPPKNDGLIFDVGGGNGYMTKACSDAGFESVLVEPSHKGILNAKNSRGIKNLVHSSFEDAKFLANSLPAVSLFDVVEHIENDKLFLQQIYESLKPGGRLYLTVPAYNWLWSSTDEFGGHYRRYTCSSLDKLLLKLGFKINFSTYFFMFLPLGIYLFRSLPYKLGKKQPKEFVEVKAEHELKRGAHFKIINAVLSWEIARMKKLNKIPFGGSCLICCTK